MSNEYYILHAKDLGMTLFQIPLLVITSTLTQVVLSYYSGTLIDKLGSKIMLFISYLFGLLTILSLKSDLIWLTFIFLGIFTVVSLNALRVYIAKNAISQGFVYGVLYGGTAIFSALGALTVGQIWSRFGFSDVVLFSLMGCGIITFILFVNLLASFVKKH